MAARDGASTCIPPTHVPINARTTPRRFSPTRHQCRGPLSSWTSATRPCRRLPSGCCTATQSSCATPRACPGSLLALRRRHPRVTETTTGVRRTTARTGSRGPCCRSTCASTAVGTLRRCRTRPTSTDARGRPARARRAPARRILTSTRAAARARTTRFAGPCPPYPTPPSSPQPHPRPGAARRWRRSTTASSSRAGCAARRHACTRRTDLAQFVPFLLWYIPSRFVYTRHLGRTLSYFPL